VAGRISGSRDTLFGHHHHPTGISTTRPPHAVGSVPFDSWGRDEHNGANPTAWGGQVAGIPSGLPGG
jgi:hypothetical protein